MRMLGHHRYLCFVTFDLTVVTFGLSRGISQAWANFFRPYLILIKAQSGYYVSVNYSLSEFDVRFHTQVREFDFSCFTDCTKHIGGRSFSSTTDNRQICCIFTQTKLSSIHRHKLTVT